MRSKCEALDIGNTETQFEIRCAPRSSVLWPIRLFACSLARQLGFDDEEIGQIEMAVDEACANVVRHAYKHLGVTSDDDSAAQSEPRPDFDTPSTECYLRVRVYVTPTLLRFSIMDNGIGVSNQPPGVQSLDEYVQKGGKGGLGIFIIRKFMDEVEVRSPKGRGTTLTMTKYIRSASTPKAQGQAPA